MLRFIIVILCAALVTGGVTALPASAGQSPWMTRDFMKVRLISAYQGAGTLESLQAGIEIALEPGWHTYWRMAGDAGAPPVFDWSASQNLKEASVHFPAPERFETQGLNSFGYRDSVLWPLTIAPVVPGAAITLALNMDTVICKDICVPLTHALRLEIPGSAAHRTEHHFRIEQAMADLPRRGGSPGLDLIAAVLGKDSVVVTAFSKDGFNNPDLFIEVEGGMAAFTRPPDVQVDADPKRAVFKISSPDGHAELPAELSGKKVTITLRNNGKAVEKDFQF